MLNGSSLTLLSQWCSHDQEVEDDWFTRSSSSSWKPMNPFSDDADPHTVSAESGEGWCLPTDEAAMPKLHWRGRPDDHVEGEATPSVKPKWIPMSAKKVREAANLMGKGKPKAKPKAKGKGVEVCEKLKEAWSDMYASDQPLCEEEAVEQYADWCDEGQPGKDMVEASFLPPSTMWDPRLDGPSKQAWLGLDTTEMECSTSTSTSRFRR